MPETKKQEKRRHFRGKARPGRRVDVTYAVAADDDAEPIAAVTANIGVGGAYILTANPEPIGTELRIQLEVPTRKETIEVKAEVRWNTTRGGDDRAGMGVKFLDLDVESLLALSEYFASLTGSDE